MNTILFQNKRYYSIEQFMLNENLSSKKSVYNWVDKGKAETKKLLNKSFFRKKD